MILCLHGAPGGSRATTRAASRTTPGREMWDVPESVRCVEHIAVTWGHHPALFGITVLNEPSNEIPIPTLADYYLQPYTTYPTRCPPRVPSQSLTLTLTRPAP